MHGRGRLGRVTAQGMLRAWVILIGIGVSRIMLISLIKTRISLIALALIALGRIGMIPITLGRMTLARIIRLDGLAPVSALHPRRRTGRRLLLLSLHGRLILIARNGPRLWLHIGPAHAATAKRIALADQASQFSQWVAFDRRRMGIVAAMIAVVGGIRSALISISHRNDASPSGKESQSLAVKNEPAASDDPTPPCEE